MWSIKGQRYFAQIARGFDIFFISWKYQTSYSHWWQGKFKRLLSHKETGLVAEQTLNYLDKHRVLEDIHIKSPSYSIHSIIIIPKWFIFSFTCRLPSPHRWHFHRKDLSFETFYQTQRSAIHCWWKVSYTLLLCLFAPFLLTEFLRLIFSLSIDMLAKDQSILENLSVITLFCYKNQ